MGESAKEFSMGTAFLFDILAYEISHLIERTGRYVGLKSRARVERRIDTS